MNNTTYTANENCFLIYGEVYLTKPYSIEQKLVDRYVIVENEVLKCAEINTKTGIGREPEGHPFIYDGALIVTHSTKPLDGVKQLPRDKFVKPVDYIELAIEEFGEDKVNRLVVDIFTKGHNANPNEFTLSEIGDAMEAAIQWYDSHPVLSDMSEFIHTYINSLRPLSLPASLEINEQGEIVNVIW